MNPHVVRKGTYQTGNVAQFSFATTAAKELNTCYMLIRQLRLASFLSASFADNGQEQYVDLERAENEPLAVVILIQTGGVASSELKQSGLMAKMSWSQKCQSCEKTSGTATFSAFVQRLLLPACTLLPYRSFIRWAV